MENFLEKSGKFQVNEDKLKLPGFVLGEAPHFHGNYHNLPYGKSKLYHVFTTLFSISFTFCHWACHWACHWPFPRTDRRTVRWTDRQSWSLFLGNDIYLRLPGNYHKCPCKRMWKTLFLFLVIFIGICGNIKRYLWKKLGL